MTAWRLMLSSLAAFSSSSSMDAVKSTLTRWMGFIILPELEKKRETSLPRSAMRAMASAESIFFLGCVFFIEFPFCRSGFPESHEMVELPFGVLADFKDDRVQATACPADGAMLHGKIGALIGVVGMKENLLHFLKTDSAFWIAAKAAAFPLIEVKSHEV